MTRRSRYALIFLGVIVAIFLVLQTPVLRKARAATWYTWTATVGKWFKVGSIDLSKSVEDQVSNLTAENVRLRAESRDYRRIRDQLGSPSFDGFKAVKGELAARPTDRFHSHYIVNRGARDGVSVGSPVVVHGSTLIGFVTELNNATSVVQLIFNPSTSIPVEVLSDDKSGRALAKGKSFTGIVLEALPHNVPARNGDKVVTLSKDMLIPHGLLVGEIDSIFSEEHEPYQRAKILASFDPDDIRYVNILVVP